MEHATGAPFVGPASGGQGSNRILHVGQSLAKEYRLHVLATCFWIVCSVAAVVGLLVDYAPELLNRTFNFAVLLPRVPGGLRLQSPIQQLSVALWFLVFWTDTIVVERRNSRAA